MSTPKRSRTSIMRSHDDVLVEIQGFYWPRLLVKPSPDSGRSKKGRPAIKIPRKLSKADKRNKALLLRQLTKTAKTNSWPSLASAPSFLPFLPSLDVPIPLRQEEPHNTSDTPATATTASQTIHAATSTISSWKPASPASATTRITGQLWPHRVEQHQKMLLSTLTPLSRPSSPTSIMGPYHQRPRAVTLESH
ncbi:hypothetical protein IV203_030061 [Nitzschia inconspicua]|uniref:Uncharacterized protein n=1 Tax=Nitzschia inconspicua TaxID=303405 RepID=A0A9K3Q1U9_9STRA|nr:hypothetical protein IV203_030061 [Nitzschia inconspicua]